jgi:hypothetical protein
MTVARLGAAVQGRPTSGGVPGRAVLQAAATDGAVAGEFDFAAEVAAMPTTDNTTARLATERCCPLPPVRRLRAPGPPVRTSGREGARRNDGSR